MRLTNRRLVNTLVHFLFCLNYLKHFQIKILFIERKMTSENEAVNRCAKVVECSDGKQEDTNIHKAREGKKEGCFCEKSRNRIVLMIV